MPVFFLLPRIRASRLLTVVLVLNLAACGATPAPPVRPSTSRASPVIPSGAPTDAPTPAAPVTAGSFGAGPNLAALRASHTATALIDGRVLVTGGYTGNGPNASAELVDANGAGVAATGWMTAARYFHTATLLDDGRVLIVGGMGSRDRKVHGRRHARPPTRMDNCPVDTT